MPDPYTLTNTAAQVDAAIQAAVNSDQAPAAAATNLVNSNRIYNAIQSEATTRAAADVVLTASIAANRTKVATFYRSSLTATSTQKVTGYTEVDADSLASESSGVITITESGTYIISFSGLYLEADGNAAEYFTVDYSVDGVQVLTQIVNQSTDILAFSASFVSDGTKTVEIQLTETGVSQLTCTDILVTLVKLPI